MIMGILYVLASLLVVLFALHYVPKVLRFWAETVLFSARDRIYRLVEENPWLLSTKSYRRVEAMLCGVIVTFRDSDPKHMLDLAASLKGALQAGASDASRANRDIISEIKAFEGGKKRVIANLFTVIEDVEKAINIYALSANRFVVVIVLLILPVTLVSVVSYRLFKRVLPAGTFVVRAVVGARTQDDGLSQYAREHEPEVTVGYFLMQSNMIGAKKEKEGEDSEDSQSVRHEFAEVVG